MSQSFPAWRLKNGIQNATDEELEHAAESCEWWSWGFAAILIVGLVGEGVLAWQDHRTARSGGDGDRSS